MFKKLFGKFSGEIHGEGPAVTREESTGQFTAIQIAGPFALLWKQGQNCSWRAKMQENLFDYLETKVRGGTLEIGFTRSISLADIEKRPTIEITSPSLDILELAGSVRAKDWDVVRGDKFSIKMAGSGRVDIALEMRRISIDKAGSGKVTLGGTANDIAISCAGSGSISTLAIPAQNVSVSSAGSGTIEVSCSDKLDVSLVGSGSVHFAGNPTLNQNVIGSGKISQIRDN